MSSEPRTPAPEMTSGSIGTTDPGTTDPGSTDPTTGNTVGLAAARYTGGPLGERVVVRLVPEPLVVAEDGVVDTFGLPPAQITIVGQTTPRTVGFPAWVIMQHPEQAANALNIDADLRRAMKQAGSKPGNARDAVVSIGTRLERTEPGFLPTFYEEAARGFLAVENEKFAAMLFTRARDAELAYALPVDEQRHQDVFLEFAQAGALNAKTLTAEAKDLARRHDPAEAVRLFTELNLARTRAGLAPYSGLSADLNRLLKGSDLDAGAARRTLLVDLLAADGIAGATPAGFWADFEADITAALAEADTDEQSAAIRSRLAGVVLRTDNEEWLALLERWNMLVHVRAGDITGWVQAALSSLHPWRRGGVRTPRLTNLVERAGERLSGHAFTIATIQSASPNLLDALLGAGATVRQTRTYTTRPDLTDWANDPNRRDLRHLLADPTLGPPTRDILLTDQRIVPVAVDIPALQQVYLDAGAQAMASLAVRPLSVRTVNDAVQTLTRIKPALDLLGESLQPLANVIEHWQQLLADTLQLGLVAEVCWPAAEQVWAAADPQLRYSADAWPAMGIVDDTRVQFVDGDHVVASGTATSRIRSATMIDGVVGVLTWHDGKLQATWGNAPAITVENSTIWNRVRGASLPVPRGRVAGTRLQRVDSTQWPDEASSVLTDGRRIWVWPKNASCYEIDPASGARLADGLPPWLAAQRERFADQPQLQLQSRALFRPVTPTTAASPVSTVGGMHAAAVFADHSEPYGWVLVAADGTALPYRATVGGTPLAPVLRPGGGLWVLTDRWVIDQTGQRLVTSLDPEGRQLMLESVAPEAWHQARPRDPAASQVLRQVTAKQVEPLLRAVIDDLHAGDGTADGQHRLGPAATKAVRKLFGRDVAPELVASIAAAARAVGWTMVDFRDLVSEPAAQQAPADAGFGENLDQTRPQAFYDVLLLNVSGGRMASASAAAAHQLGTRPRKEPVVEGVGSVTSWAELIGREAALLYVAAAPHTPEPTRDLALDMFDHLARFGYLDHPWTVRTIDTQALREHGNAMLAGKHLLAGPSPRGALVLTKGADVDGPVGQWAVTNTLAPSGPRDRTGLEQLARRIRAGERFVVPADAATTLGATTGLSPAAATMLAHGVPHVGTYQKNFLPAPVREALGLKATETSPARDELRSKRPDGSFLRVLAAGVPADDPTRLLTNGPDLAAMAEVWGGRPAPITLTDEQRTRFNARWGKGSRWSRVDALVQRPHELTRPTQWVDLLAQLAWLTDQLPLDDPARPQVERQLADLVELLPPERQPRATALRAHLAEPPRAGYAANPQLSAPEVVAAVAEHHRLSADAAAYYLQLLAFMEPHDVDVRRWNGWTARVLTAARAELVENKLVVEGKRPRAKRTAFLPGAWRDAKVLPPHEVWKGMMLARLDATAAAGSALFEAAWQATVADPPSFDELSTERRR